MYDVQITDYEKASKVAEKVRLGYAFAFLDAGVSAAADGQAARRKRLQIDSPATGREVIALATDPVDLPGALITPRVWNVDRVAGLSTDRDLYKSENDTVYIHAAFASQPASAAVHINCNGSLLMRRELEVIGGMAIEPVAMLLAGEYEATLEIDGNVQESHVRFTVAEFSLAPISARLVSHEFERESGQLSFSLLVESYQQPLDGNIEVALVENGHVIDSTLLGPQGEGAFSGHITGAGDTEAALRLQITMVDDPARVAEVALPGTRRRERETTCMSELGQERLFCMLPEPGSISTHGGYLSDGQFFETPIVVEEVLTAAPTIQLRRDVESMVLVVHDLASGESVVNEIGDRKAGTSVQVESGSTASCVFIGAWIDGQPFEAFTTFMRPREFGIGLEVLETPEPGGKLRLAISAIDSTDSIRALLCIRDARLTQADRPSLALGASLKRGVDTLTESLQSHETRSLGDYGADEVAVMDELDLGSADFGEDPLVGKDGDWEELDVDLEGGGDLVLGAGAPLASALPVTRSEFPQVVFFAAIDVEDVREMVIPLGDALTTYSIEVFALHDGSWVEASETVVVDQPLRVDLDLPPFVNDSTPARGRLRADSLSETARVSLVRDGKPVPLTLQDGGTVDADQLHTTPIELFFDVTPGSYLAEVRELDSGAYDRIQQQVDPLGSFNSLSRAVQLLQAGEQIDLETSNAVGLRLLPAIQQPAKTMTKVTMNYEHHCCEQTAAKILAAMLMYLSAVDATERRKSEEIIIAGIARERLMFTEKRGFRMYPDDDHYSEYYSKLAVRYLWKLNELLELKNLSNPIRHALKEGLFFADTAARFHDMDRVPENIGSVEDAYTVACMGLRTAEARQCILDTIDFSAATPVLFKPVNVVRDRSTLAYAAAALIALRERERAMRCANTVLAEVDDKGSLYSTMDSVACLTMFAELQRSGLMGGSVDLKVNGEAMTLEQAVALDDQVESVVVSEGCAIVEVNRIREENWISMPSSFTVDVELRFGAVKPSPGDRVELVVSLPEGYTVGDLLHVALSPALDWIEGGGKVKRFSMDFAGRDEIRVPLVVTSALHNDDCFALCVRNMFEEERVSSPGLVAVAA